MTLSLLIGELTKIAAEQRKTLDELATDILLVYNQHILDLKIRTENDSLLFEEFKKKQMEELK